VVTPPMSRPALRAPQPLLAERPHAHIVCRGCGRIAPVALETEEELRLEAIARAAPEGWAVDLVAFSLTGTCPRCQQGPAAPD
jgi:Fe2+ or Zn2+ uptake regulation protein